MFQLESFSVGAEFSSPFESDVVDPFQRNNEDEEEEVELKEETAEKVEAKEAEIYSFGGVVGEGGKEEVDDVEEVKPISAVDMDRMQGLFNSVVVAETGSSDSVFESDVSSRVEEVYKSRVRKT